MVTVIVPVLNESATIATVVEFARCSANVSEVIVVDDGSIDGTPDLAQVAGARVLTSTLLGKGASMEDGMRAAKNEILLYLDGDLTGLCDDLIERMTAPLLEGTTDFVKASFSRRAGRVTVLAAKPLLQTFFPELSNIEQPLGGIIAARRSVLYPLCFETDYGVDIGLLLDVYANGARIAQVDIGHIEHSSQPLEVLGDMAKQVVRVILNRASRQGRLDFRQLCEVDEVERHSQAELSAILQGAGHSERLALFDMDGTLLNGRFIVSLAIHLGKTADLAGLLDNAALSSEERTRQISAVFQGIAKDVFEEVARTIPLMPGAAEVVVALRKRGYRVGIVSDSYRIATEIVRRRVFAEFSIAHLMRFRHGVATGEVTLTTAMRHNKGCTEHTFCKKNTLLHLCEHFRLSPDRVLAVGDSDSDICMLSAAGMGIAVQPKTNAVKKAACHVVNRDLQEIMGYIDLNMD